MRAWEFITGESTKEIREIIDAMSVYQLRDFASDSMVLGSHFDLLMALMALKCLSSKTDMRTFDNIVDTIRPNTLAAVKVYANGSDDECIENALNGGFFSQKLTMLLMNAKADALEINENK